MRTPQLLLTFLLIGATLGDRPAAQSSSQPTITIRRMASLNSSVWPGDFNGDGITDLAATAPFNPDGSPPPVVLSLGRGDGTFRTPTPTGFSGEVLAVADVDRDGKSDLVISVRSNDGEVFVAFGNGDGTFTRISRVHSFQWASFALVDDLDGDGFNDIVVASNQADEAGVVQIYPGRADGTYPESVTVTGAVRPGGGVIADLNGDGKKDLVVANHDSSSLSVFLNRGAFMFTPSDIPFDRFVDDVVAADVNHDGKMDLLAALSENLEDDFVYATGDVAVLLGRGDGTFAAPVLYPTAKGAWRIVVGDFTRDGILDVATANRSADFAEDCGPVLRGTDSVSILPGAANGTFGAASSFALGAQNNPQDTRFRNTVLSLNTSDLNGDGKTDLIASWGAMLINNPPDPNWAPTVDAGPDQTTGNAQIHLSAIASDVDQDYLTYTWTASNGMFLEPVADPCVDLQVAGTYTFTVTVDDGHGHRVSDAVTVSFGGGGEDHTIHISAPATGEVITSGQPYTIRWTAAAAMGGETLLFYVSTDGGASFTHIWECDYTEVTVGQCVWRNPGPASENAIVSLFTRDADFDGSGSTGPFSIRTPAGALPWPWLDSDIGAVGAAGGAGFSNDLFSVRGSGADIWGTADEFNYAYQQFSAGSGDMDVVARVDSVQNVQPWTKAGLMVRLGLTADAPHASIFVTPGKGVAFQRRPTRGAASISTSGAVITAPAWLRLSIRGNYVIAYYKKNQTDGWTKLGDQKFAGSGYGAPYAGLAVTSHLDGTVAAATFSNVSLTPVDTTWTTSLVGSTVGSATLDATASVFTITNRGVDIWGASDQFTFINTSFYGDGDVSASIRTLQNTSVWAKAGVMFRSTLATNSPHVSLFVTPGKGIAMQYRSDAGGTSVQVGQVAGAVPVLLKLTRSGNTFTGAWSSDVTTWHTVGTVTLNLGSEALVGVPLTSHDSSTTATAEGAGVNLVHR